ncbi:MAG TPA: hypothetical protein VF060_25170 [Trebonia sp.]
MDFDVLPGPPLAELARTTMASVSAAVVTSAGSPALLPATVPVRAGRRGDPVLLPSPGSMLARHLAAGPAMVTVTVPAEAPFSALRLTGMTRPGVTQPGMTQPGITRSAMTWPDAPRDAYQVVLNAVEFRGSVPTQVALAQYEAAAPDPFRREAPAILRHLERCHMTDLVGCVRAHGITAAEWVIPRRLDRFGLELLVLAPSGLAAVRLAFPGGPVSKTADVPLSIRTILNCQCASESRQSEHLPWCSNP